jgi:hypothetical protein
VEIRSIRGIDTLRVHHIKLVQNKPMVQALSFPLFRPIKVSGLPHLVNRIGQRSSRNLVERAMARVGQGEFWILEKRLKTAAAASSLKSGRRYGQATKGPRWMPRHQAPKKDAATCEKRRGVGSKR